jgi:hypothetical protein
LVELVNASHYDLAMRLCECLDLGWKRWSDPAVEIERTIPQRDALFSLAVLDLQGDVLFSIERGRDRFGLVAMIIERTKTAKACELMAANRMGQIVALDRLGDHDAQMFFGKFSRAQQVTDLS